MGSISLPIWSVIVILIILLVVFLFAVKKLVEGVLNLISIIRTTKDPYSHVKSSNFVVNKKEKRVEADNSIITPFD